LLGVASCEQILGIQPVPIPDGAPCTYPVTTITFCMAL